VFECKQECQSNCCEFVVLNCITATNDNIDKQYLDLRNIEFSEKKLNEQIKQVYFKIPITCKWLKENKCINYKDRPLACKLNGGGSLDSPFKINNCPYNQ